MNDNLGPQWKGNYDSDKPCWASSCKNGKPESFPASDHHLNREHADWASRNADAGRTDGWGTPMKKAYDGHSAWSCNNYNCAEHPNEMYEQNGLQGLPGWMKHDNDPQKDAKFEVDKAFHESGLSEDAQWLLNQQKDGPKE